MGQQSVRQAARRLAFDVQLVRRRERADPPQHQLGECPGLADRVRRHDHGVVVVDDGRLFVGPYGVTPSRHNFATIWNRAKKAVGDLVPPNLHFHDLRHAGNHFAASSGASTRELMGRLGHASMRAALIYQHRTMTRDRAIAEALDALIEQRQR